MRKSLLITSALGFAAVLPTLAVAGSVAGSSSAACCSGFFAQIDAKIMNAKLQIKNEKKFSIAADQDVSDDGIAKEIKASRLNDLQNVEVKTLLDLDIGAGTPDKAAVLTEIGAYTLAEIADDAKIDAKVAGRVGAVAALRAAWGNGAQKAAIIQYFQEIRRLGNEAGLAGNVTAGDVIPQRQIKLGDVRGVTRVNGETIPAVVAKFDSNEITDTDKDYRSIKTIYVVGTENAGAGLDVAGLKTAVYAAFKGVPFVNAFNASADGSVAFKQLIGSLKNGRIQTNAELQKQRDVDLTDRFVHHHALAGGAGATVGWWQSLGGFALSLSGSGDYHWGTFRTMDDKSGETVKAADKKRLGFGFQGDAGVHYVVSPSTTLGVLVGVRGQQLQFGRTTTATKADSKDDYASKWVINPTVSAQARTFFTDNVYGALTVGYVIPMSEKEFGLEDTNVDKDAKIRFQGLTGAFSVGMVF